MTEPLRVVFLTHNYPRERGDVAGAFLHPLAVALRARGVDVRVVTPSDAGKGGRGTLDGVPVHRVRYAAADREQYAQSGKLATATKSPQGLKALAGMIRALRAGAREELDGATRGVVHAHWWFPSGLAAPSERPMVVTCHGTDVRMLETSGPARWLAKRPFHRARRVTTVSRSLADALRTHGAKVADDSVVPMPVTAMERPWSIGGGGIVVLGRLTEQKRVHLAVEAYALARQQGCTLPLVIAGDGATRAALQSQVGGLGLSAAVQFLGAVAPTDVPALLATADACLMPARGEGFGLAAAEALMQGVPVIACTDGGGLLDVVPMEGAGRRVSPEPAALAAALVDVLHDPDARTTARVAGEAWRIRLAPEFVAERFLTWYGEALDE
ncbi:MAG: glycosyltransferase family 4 protein [Gemmatimonadetes bacterium]|nr:glycosyltransferase family 4 protein [Gemmatimonadota bacterium]MBK9549517.1 glycosyltransferase family 4 protein [Gemmatimonadota bacterium]MBP7620529.1 glycosyltransferase family 4 protein [Gemmatimonadales bacterium]